MGLSTLYLKGSTPTSFSAAGHVNIERHLHDQHSLEDATGWRIRKKSTESPAGPPDKQRRIDTLFKLNAEVPREQALINTLKLAFNRDHFQKLLINWIVESNLPFRTIEHPRLREAFMYLNPLVEDSNALVTHPTARRILVDEYKEHHGAVKLLLRNSPGLIHIAFDGWSSRNKHALYGITCSFLDYHFKARKIVLGLPELMERHTGENIATEVIEIITSYEISDKIGYFTLDNATNNDTAMEAIADHFSLGNAPERRVRCIGHIINLAVKALLFGKNHQAFEEAIPDAQALEVATHRLWQKTGPVGKLHNIVTWINRSDTLAQAFLKLQKDYSESNPSKRIKVLHLVSDNATRWLSQFYMIERALKLRNFIEDLWDNQAKAYCRSHRSKKDIPLCLQPDSKLTDSDWSMLQELQKLFYNFNVVLLILQGDSVLRDRVDGCLKAYGLIWQVIPAFEFLLDKLEKAKKEEVENSYRIQWQAAVNCAWDRLDKYYQLLDDCPAYYAFFVALHPRYRWRYFETKWSTRESWTTGARAAVQRLRDSDYKKRPVSNHLTIFRPLQLKVSFVSPFDQYSDTVSPPLMPDLDEPKDLPDDEYERWHLSTATDIDVEDPLEYWYNKRSEYPRLCQMAVDILSIHPMSAECERLFLSSGLMVTPLRSRLETTTIGLAQTVRSWLKAGVIHDSVMDVPDLDTMNHRGEGSDPVKNDFNEESDDDTGAVSLLEDGNGDGDSDVVTLYD